MRSFAQHWAGIVGAGGIATAVLGGVLSGLPLVSFLGGIPVCFWLLVRNYGNFLAGATVGVAAGGLSSWYWNDPIPLASLVLGITGSFLLLRRNGWPRTLATMVGMCILGTMLVNWGVANAWVLGDLVQVLGLLSALVAEVSPRLGAGVAALDLQSQLAPILGVGSILLGQIYLLGARYLQSTQQRPGGFAEEIAGVLWRLRDWVLWLAVAALGWQFLPSWSWLLLSLGLIVPCAAAVHGYDIAGWLGWTVLCAYWSIVAAGMVLCFAMPSLAWISTCCFVLILVLDAFVDGRGMRLQRKLMRLHGPGGATRNSSPA